MDLNRHRTQPDSSHLYLEGLAKVHMRNRAKNFTKEALSERAVPKSEKGFSLLGLGQGPLGSSVWWHWQHHIHTMSSKIVREINSSRSSMGDTSPPIPRIVGEK